MITEDIPDLNTPDHFGEWKRKSPRFLKGFPAAPG
jgi:hypothetical protein